MERSHSTETRPAVIDTNVWLDLLVFEDTAPGVRGALAAGMRCIAVGAAPGDEVRAVAPAVVPRLSAALIDPVLPTLRSRGSAGR